MSVDPELRNYVLLALKKKSKGSEQFQELIESHGRLSDISASLKIENLQLTVQNERLRQENLDLQTRYTGAPDGKSSERVQALEQKLYTLQEEVTDLHRKKGEHSQQVLDLNAKLTEKEKEVATKENRFSELQQLYVRAVKDLSDTKNKVEELTASNQLIRDEYDALHLAYGSMEKLLRKLQEENQNLVEQLIEIKKRDADYLNAENDQFIRTHHAKVRRELEEAVKEQTTPVPADTVMFPVFLPATSLPDQAFRKFDAHDGEVTAVKWSPNGRWLTTGGSDRKVKLWDFKQGAFECKYTLTGSNASVMSIDFDSTGTLLIAGSNDYACRVWTVDDGRLRHTLTGHTNKVLAARFLGDPTKAVSGSYDRTIRIWDLRQKSCISTKLTVSSCNDIAVLVGGTIVSGHFDKKIRFWDERTDASHNDILLNGKITSLDVSKDSNTILACSRNDELCMIDVRQYKVLATFTDDRLKVGFDWSRACFSSSGQQVTVGGADGSVFIWDTTSGKLERYLKEHQSSIEAVAWHPYENTFVSVEKSKKVILWTSTGK
ncbi:autophagy-related protein 16-1-like isoform X2 [Artemia franciscana]|uniref:autophagy-related protein 16-1-like isoform X2 n=1 Tax=Artemia franciscana TaxID=6661 RepID=UPI0032DA1C09